MTRSGSPLPSGKGPGSARQGRADMLKRLWRLHPRLMSAFVLAVVLALGLGLRSVLMFPGKGDPDRPVAPWMTPGFIVHTYGLDPDEVGAILHLEPGSRNRNPVQSIVLEQGLDPAEVMQALVAAVERQRLDAADE